MPSAALAPSAPIATAIDEPEDPVRSRAIVWLSLAAALLLAIIGVAWLGGTSDEPTPEPALAQATVPEAPPQTSPPAPEPAPPEVTEPEPLEPPPLEPDGELEPVPEAIPEPELDPSPAPRSSSKRRRRRKSTPEPEPTFEEPDPEPAPVRPPPRPDPPSARELLGRAQSALRRGEAREAYRLASQSNRTRSSEDALTLMARAACTLGNEEDAKRAFKKVPLTHRGSIRRECRQLGVRVGI
ncbi:MAG: hypothetical protein H6712_06525 [Myxococcales bacterium]|nr:hypothetical protein [Myxococcales bacterium]MCB9713490.1 hypothetical protein [Myxococcales bacterium]